MATVIFSYVSHDIITKPVLGISSIVSEKIGGKAYYTGQCLAHLGEKTRIFIKSAPYSKLLLTEMNHRNIQLINILSDSTPMFENRFLDEGMENRKFIGKLTNNTFSAKDIKMHPGAFDKIDLVHLAPSYPTEFTDSFLTELHNQLIAPENDFKVSLDLDFFIKKCTSRGYSYVEPKSLSKLLNLASYVVISEEDYHMIKGQVKNYPHCEFVITCGKNGAWVCRGGMNYLISARKVRNVVDTTGAGDTFIAAYLHGRKTKDIRSAGSFASTIAARKIQSTKAYGCK